MVKVTLSKTTKVLIILAVALILGGSGGYLLWRVNQEKTVAPTDSDAGGSNAGCSASAPACNCTGTAAYFQNCYEANGTLCGNIACNGAIRCQCSDGWKTSTTVTSCKTLCGEDDGSKPTTKCSCAGGYGNNCGINCKFPSGTSCQAKANAACEPYVAMCNQDGTVSCEVYNENHKCYGQLEICNNPLFEPNCTKNTCDDGSWKSKPTGTYEYCEEISYTAEGTDSDGIDEASITAKLNNSAKATFDKTSTATTTTITDDLSTTTECLDPGEYTLDLTWKDKKGASSTDCTLTTTFEVLEQGIPDDWEISKKASEECLNEDTENPTSVISYVITVTNNAAQEESLDKIIDVLDTKVLQSYLGSISGGGTFASGSITWELEGTAETFTAGQSKTYTYTVTIPETVFGSYTNTVTGYPKEGDNFSDTETIIADCVVTPDEQPQTGIFDSTISKVLLGILMIMIGFNLHKISQVQLFLKKFGTSIDEVSDERRKRNFERKIVKK